RTALITTKGFEDVIEIGRQARPDLYNLMVTRPSPLVSRELRFGLEERTGPTGQIITPLAEDSIARLVKLISNHNPRLESAAAFLVCESGSRRSHCNQVGTARHSSLSVAQNTSGVSRVRTYINGRNQRLFSTVDVTLPQRIRRRIKLRRQSPEPESQFKARGTA